MVARDYDIDAYGNSLVQNMADAQLSTGLVPDLVPENIVFVNGFRDDVNWGSAMIMTPWAIYQNYGDTAVLSTYYPNMVAYMNFLVANHGSGALVTYGSNGLGDWGETSVTTVYTPIDLVENWGYYRDEVAMANIAGVLGKTADQQTYTANAAATLAAFTAMWYTPGSSTVANGTQSSLAMALDIGAVPASATAAVTQTLLNAINAAGGFAVGEIGLTPLFRVLSAAGDHQLIYNAVTANKVGGYGYFVAQGLTSLPEYWNITSGSRNHWMLGGVDNWITGNIAGIQQAPGSVDFQSVVIQPAVVGNMTSASGSFQTNHGTIASSWTNSSSAFSLTATIPVGSTAASRNPGRRYIRRQDLRFRPVHCRFRHLRVHWSGRRAAARPHASARFHRLRRRLRHLHHPREHRSHGLVRRRQHLGYIHLPLRKLRLPPLHLRCRGSRARSAEELRPRRQRPSVDGHRLRRRLRHLRHRREQGGHRLVRRGRCLGRIPLRIRKLHLPPRNLRRRGPRPRRAENL
jgi:hypothetical protein